MTQGDVSADPLSADEEKRMWRLEHYLLAAILDSLAAANWQRGGGKGKRPKPTPRPGVGPERVIKKKSRLTPEEKMSILRALRPGGGGLNG